MSNPLVILGSGGFAREVLSVVEAINLTSPTWDMLGFVVDTQYGETGTIVNNKPILGNFSWFSSHPTISVVCGVGAPEIRWEMIKRLNDLDVHFATLIHPSVLRTPWMNIGAGSVITAGCILSNQVSILDHVHINPSTTIGHDVQLESFVSIAPGVLVSGNVHICEGAYIGTGAAIIEKTVIHEWAIVGAGSTIINNVPANTTVVGNPARVIKARPDGWYRHENK